MRKIIRAALLVFLAFFAFFSLPAFCAEPEPDSDLAKEIEIGRRAMKDIEHRWEMTSDPAVVSKLEMIVNRLEPFMSRRINWEVRLVKTEAMNAFCLPGGFIFFTTGMIDALNTDSEFAAVMAHEMIHADRKHSLRMAADTSNVSLGALAVTILSAAGGAIAPMILAQVANVAITSSYTLELEAEADKFGLDALIKSGYSPTGMVTLFERFMAEEYKQPIVEYGIYMNHPGTSKRLEAVVKTLHEKKIPIERKYSLGLLRTVIQETDGEISLNVDGLEVAKAKKTSETRAVMTEIKNSLDKYLQLELAPYEIHVARGSLYIENHFIVGNIEGMTKPEEIRGKLLKVINADRAKYPTSKFFK